MYISVKNHMQNAGWLGQPLSDDMNGLMFSKI